MLNEPSRKKAEKLLELIIAEIQGIETYDITLGDIQWLAVTLLELDNGYKQHTDCCLPNKESCAYRKEINT
jgi:hypothetical protein